MEFVERPPSGGRVFLGRPWDLRGHSELAATSGPTDQTLLLVRRTISPSMPRRLRLPVRSPALCASRRWSPPPRTRARPPSRSASRLRRYAFNPPRIEVNQDDLVKIELRTEDIAHSLTIDAYRIAKRVGPGHPVTFEFRADRAGTFPYYCNLQIDDGCRQMHGELVVRPR